MVAIGDKVDVNGARGIVRYIGHTRFASGIWYGIELDEQVGKNDGSIQGKRYFELEKKGLYGIFAKLQSMKVIGSKSQLSSNAEVARLLKENGRLRKQLQNAEAEGPNDIIEFLTMETSDLTKRIETLKDELDTSKRREEAQTKLQVVYMEMEKELRDQLDELEISYEKELEMATNEKARLAQQLAEKTCPRWEMRELQSKLKIMEQQLYENKLLKDLYEISSISGEDSKGAQFEFLSEKVLDERISNDFVEKQKCRVILIILSAISRICVNENKSDGFFKDLGDISQWTPPFLTCLVPKEKIQITPINRFLDSHPELDTNISLAVKCMIVIFGKVVPELLAYHMENATHKPPLESITELYSVCLLIKKKCQTSLDQVSDTGGILTTQEEFSLINLFTIIFSDILGPFESEFQDACILQSITNILRQVESIMVKEQVDEYEKTTEEEDPEAGEFTSSTGVIPTDDMKAQLHKKETELKELIIKNQVYQKRLEDFNGHATEFGNMQREISNLREHNNHLGQKVSGLEILIEDLQQKLQYEQVKGCHYGSNDDYGALTMELINSDKLDLISEIRDLRSIVSRRASEKNRVPLNLEWLHKRVPTDSFNMIDLGLSNGFHSLGNEILDLVNYSQTVDLDSNGLRRNYMENARFKMSIIDSAIKDIRAN